MKASKKKYDPLKAFYYNQELLKKTEGKSYDPVLDSEGIEYLDLFKNDDDCIEADRVMLIEPNKPENPEKQEKKPKKQEKLDIVIEQYKVPIENNRTGMWFACLVWVACTITALLFIRASFM